MFDFISRFIFKLKYNDKIISDNKVKEIFDNCKNIFEFNIYLTNTNHKYKDVTLATAIYNFNKTSNEFFATYDHTCLDFANIYKQFCDYKQLQSEQIYLKKSLLKYHKILIIVYDNKIYLMSNNIITEFESRNAIIMYYNNKGYIEI